jgi:predicted transcriptional regulator
MRIEDSPEQSKQGSSEQTLEACVLALSRWKGTLSPELHSKIRTAGEQLRQNPSAIGELRDLLGNSELKDSYYAARQELYQKYRDRERSKSGIASLSSSNLILELAVPILTADNFSSAAHRLVTQSDWSTRVKNASDDGQIFFKTLKDSATQITPLPVELLKILAEDIFTIDGLAYRVDRTEEEIKPALEELWQRGYINPVSSTVAGNLWRSLNVFSRKLDTSGYLFLTAKGNYYLDPHHPLFAAFKSPGLYTFLTLLFRAYAFDRAKTLSR